MLAICTWQSLVGLKALLNPETSISIQKRHHYTGNLSSETSRDSEKAFLQWGVQCFLSISTCAGGCFPDAVCFRGHQLLVKRWPCNYL